MQRTSRPAAAAAGLVDPRSRPCRPGVPRRLVARAALVCALAGTGAAMLASVAGAMPTGCTLSGRMGGTFCPIVTYTPQTIDDQADPTFNQLLGINTNGLIAGYFGVGDEPNHPNQGYVLVPQYTASSGTTGKPTISTSYTQGTYVSNNYPGSAQTQVTGLNNKGTLVGFYSKVSTPATSAGANTDDNEGWYEVNGVFHHADFVDANPGTAQNTPIFDQLLGVNDSNVAVGFYQDPMGVNHGYEWSIATGSATPVAPTGFSNVTAAAINDSGDVAGFGSTANGTTDGFLMSSSGVTTLAFPGATSTNALGVNNSAEVVGVYTDSAGKIHGFTWNQAYGFKMLTAPRRRTGGLIAGEVPSTIDAPSIAGTTTINGIDNCGDLVGFYVDANGNTNGLLETANYSATTYALPAGSSSERDIAVRRDATFYGKKKKKRHQTGPKPVLPPGC